MSLGGDDIDKMLEEGLARADRRSRSRSHSRSRRRRHRSRSRDRHRETSEERRLERERNQVDRDRRTVFASQIHPRVDERDIFEFFSQCGKVRDVQLIKDMSTGKSKGLSYVEFHEQTSVSQALGFTGQLLGGYPISVQVTQSEKNRAAAAMIQTTTEDSPMRLYISNVAADIASEDLDPIFSALGGLEFVELKKELDSTGSKSGFIQFQKGSEANAALKNLNGLSLLGKNIVLSQVDMTNITSAAANAAASFTANIPGISMHALDEGQGGMQLTATSRAMLMQRLQASADPNGSVAAAQLMNPMQANITNMPPASQFVRLSSMFDPTKESDKNWEKDIREDVMDECSKFGRVLHCAVDKNSLGQVYLKFDSAGSAQKSISALNGRWFAQKQIGAQFIDQSLYERRYPDSTNK